MKHKTIRRYQSVNRTGVAAGRLDRIMDEAGIPAADRDLFLRNVLSQLWNEYKTNRMNRRILIENEIRQLGIRLPNGTVKKDYEFSFRLPADTITEVELSGAEDLGLDFAMDSDGLCSLCGKPRVAGDFSLTLRFRTVEGEPVSELPIPVAFNPDPRSLWRDVPTDRDILYFKEDSDSLVIGDEGGTRKTLVAASRRGRSHAQEGKARDDHFALCHCDRSDWFILAVADGAGSARYSRKGSEKACNTIVEYCKARLGDNPEFESAIRAYGTDMDNTEKRTVVTRHVIDVIYNGARKAHEAVCGLSRHNDDMKPKDFATTLMFAVCRKYDFGWFIATFWVGDGAMCLFDEKRGTAKLLGTPDEGEFSGQTRFLTMPEIFRDPDVVSKRLRMTVVPDFTALFLMSDGVSDPMFETDRNLNDYDRWKEFWRRLKTGFPDDGIMGVDFGDWGEATKDQLLGWLDFWSPGNHDDRTIAILY